MKNLIVIVLAIVMVAVMLYAGINGIMRDHSYGPFFIFLAVCSATGLGFDITKTIKEKIRRSNIRKFGR